MSIYCHTAAINAYKIMLKKLNKYFLLRNFFLLLYLICHVNITLLSLVEHTTSLYCHTHGWQWAAANVFEAKYNMHMICRYVCIYF